MGAMGRLSTSAVVKKLDADAKYPRAKASNTSNLKNILLKSRSSSTADAAALRAVKTTRFNRERRAFRDGDHELLLDSRGRQKAFDLATDPGQESPVREAAWIDPLRARADAWIAARSPSSDEGASHPPTVGESP